MVSEILLCTDLMSFSYTRLCAESSFTFLIKACAGINRKCSDSHSSLQLILNVELLTAFCVLMFLDV